jgi:hypothetical protein
VAPTEPGARELAARASVAFDEDGFTLEWSAVRGPRSVAYLAVAGGAYSVGADVMPRRRRRRRTPVGLAPAGALFASWGLGPDEENRHISRLSLGAAAASGAAGCVTWAEQIEDTVPTHTLARSSASSVVVGPATRPGAPGLHAQAIASGFDDAGFTLRWPVTDERRRQFLYVALGSRRARRSLLQRLRRGSPAHLLRRPVAGTVDEDEGAGPVRDGQHELRRLPAGEAAGAQ